MTDQQDLIWRGALAVSVMLVETGLTDSRALAAAYLTVMIAEREFEKSGVDTAPAKAMADDAFTLSPRSD